MDDEAKGNAPSGEERAEPDKVRDRRAQMEQLLAEADAQLRETAEIRRRLKEALDESDEVSRKLMEETFDSKGKVTRGERDRSAPP